MRGLIEGRGLAGSRRSNAFHYQTGKAHLPKLEALYLAIQVTLSVEIRERFWGAVLGSLGVLNLVPVGI